MQATSTLKKPGLIRYGKAIANSVLLHVCLLLLLILNVDLSFSPDVERPANIIDAMVVDSSVLEPVKKPPVVEEKVTPKVVQEKKVLPKIDKEKEKKALADQQARLAEKKRAAELQAQKEREKQQQIQRQQELKKMEALRQEELAREQAKLKAEEELAQQKLFEQQQAERAARAKQQQASELAILRGQYQSAINQKISRNWIKPVSIQGAEECEILINQIPGGEVINVIVESCSGDSVFQRSVENAVGKVSPLPYEGFEKVFDRNIRFIFRAEQ